MPEESQFSERITDQFQVEIRPCSEDEVSTITDTEPPGQDYARHTHQRQIDGHCLYLVAWDGTAPVGSGEIEWSSPPELKNLHVPADSRGLGIGSKLVLAAEDACKAHGSLRIGVAEDNPIAARLYERLGYVRTGEKVTDSYTYVDEGGTRHHATETSEYLVKDLTNAIKRASED